MKGSACLTMWREAWSTVSVQVKLLPPKHVRAFVLRDKTDVLDAQLSGLPPANLTFCKCQSRANSSGPV
jgi:hypothetical protein